MKAVIPAAGLGTRFLPYTKSQPKEMLPIIDKPAIQYVVEEAVAAGIRDILIVTGRGKRAIEDHFDVQTELEELLRARGLRRELETVESIAKLGKILYVRQGAPRGLGHAVLAAERFIGSETFAVLLGDDVCISAAPCTKSLSDLSEELRGSVVAVSRVAPEKAAKYGIVEGTEVRPGLFRVDSIVEKPSPAQTRSNLATIGRYCLRPTIWSMLREVAPGRDGEIQLTDALRLLIESEELYAWVFPGRRFDIGDKVDWIRATVTLALERPELSQEVVDVLNDITKSLKR